MQLKDLQAYEILEKRPDQRSQSEGSFSATKKAERGSQ